MLPKETIIQLLVCVCKMSQCLCTLHIVSFEKHAEEGPYSYCSFAVTHVEPKAIIFVSQSVKLDLQRVQTCVWVSVHVCLWECPIQQVQPFCIRLQCIVSTTLWFIVSILVYSRARDLTWLQKTCWRGQRFDSKEPKSRVNVRCRGALNLASRVNH